MTRVPAAEADAIVPGNWFGNYTRTVEVLEGETRWASLDASARAKENGNSEYILVKGDLVIDGDVDLGRDTHSIFVVTGHLSARRVILGDAVLVVGGTIRAREWVFGPMGEGLLDVGGIQIEADAEGLLALITAPVVVLLDRKAREFRIVIDGVARDTNALVSDVLDDGEVDEKRLRGRLESGASLVGM